MRMSLLEKLKEAKKVAIQNGAILNKRDKNLYPILDYPFNKPRHWEIGYLSDVSIIQEGPGIRKHQYTQSGIQFLTVTNILEDSLDLNKSLKYISEQEYETKYKHFEINPGDVVTACSGATWGKSAIFDSRRIMILNTSTLRLRFFGDLGNNKYLFYLTKWNYFKKQVSSFSTGQQPNYGYKHYSQVKIPIPPIHEQQQIVQILDQTFEKIDCAIANIEQNINNAVEFFENWTFQTIKNSNWGNLKWGEVCDFTRGPFGGSLKKSIFVESGYAIYEQKQAIHNDYDSLRYFIDEEKFQEMKRFEVKSGDLLMSCSGVTLGRISEVPEDAPKGIINQALLKLSTKPDKVLNDFLMIWIRSKIFQDFIFKVAGGAAQPNVPGVKILKNINLPCPTIKEQQDFIKLHDSMKEFVQNYIEAKISKNELLEELKKSLLEKAFKGELAKQVATV